MVMRRAGSASPDATSAARTRSLASDTALSGRPTMLNAGSPGATCTWTSTATASIPWNATVLTRWTIRAPAKLLRPGPLSCRGQPLRTYRNGVAIARTFAEQNDSNYTGAIIFEVSHDRPESPGKRVAAVPAGPARRRGRRARRRGTALAGPALPAGQD